MEIYRRPNIYGYNVASICNISSTRIIFSRLKGRLEVLSANKLHGLDQVHAQAHYSVSKVAALFKNVANTNDDITLTFVRIQCDPARGPASVFPTLFRDDMAISDSTHRAILCITHDNVTGGIHSFKSDKDLLMRDLLPGDMIIYKPSDVLHTCKTPYSIYPSMNEYGFVDVMLFQGEKMNTSKVS